MKTVILIVKRSLNVALIMTILWSIISAIIFINTLHMSINENFFAHGILPEALGYSAILVVNYIFFGRVTLWHRTKPDSPNGNN